MRRNPILIGLALLGIVLLFFFISIYGISRLSPGRIIGEGGKVGVIPISGVVLDPRETVDQIKAFRQQGEVKALVIRIDSPGGGVGPSQEIYRELEKISDKKVVASMGAVAASGGYYIALGAQKIYSNPGTITGSIGVIMGSYNIEGLLKKLGLKSYTIKSGRYKDVGSPLREMTQEDRELLEGVINSAHRQFVDAVVKRRKLPREKVIEIADGRILTGEQAKKLGLVDELGNLEDAIEGAARMAGIKGKPEVVYPRRRFSLLEFLLGMSLKGLLERLIYGDYSLNYLLLPRS